MNSTKTKFTTDLKPIIKNTPKGLQKKLKVEDRPNKPFVTPKDDPLTILKKF